MRTLGLPRLVAPGLLFLASVNNAVALRTAATFNMTLAEAMDYVWPGKKKETLKELQAKIDLDLEKLGHQVKSARKDAQDTENAEAVERLLSAEMGILDMQPNKMAHPMVLRTRSLAEQFGTWTVAGAILSALGSWWANHRQEYLTLASEVIIDTVMGYLASFVAAMAFSGFTKNCQLCKDYFSSIAAAAGVLMPLSAIAANRMIENQPINSSWSVKTRCHVVEDDTVNKGWSLAEYVRFPWHAQLIMESWYQPQGSMDCTSARYLTSATLPKWGAPSPNSGYDIDVVNRAKTLTNFGDTQGFLCANRVTSRHGLRVAPCMALKMSITDRKDEQEFAQGTVPEAVNYWVLSYDENYMGGYAIIVAGQPDMTSPDGTCSFLNPYFRGGMWLMTRRRSLSPEQRAEMKTYMREKLNLDTSELFEVNQEGCAEQER
mmetsp:Transcript_25735/g.58566  ORF Transcript_25735/g.58566 Transcript_25735/m.58566 type:complete len:433 (-) Transcript_25735:58-1356(-)